jgi:hypothetical protein
MIFDLAGAFAFVGLLAIPFAAVNVARILFGIWFGDAEDDEAWGSPEDPFQN